MSTSSDDDYSAYYCQDIIFSVEGQLFKVPKTYFEQHSDVFRGMFTLPNVGTNKEGMSDHNPLRLEGVKKKDFVRLLRVMYPRSVNSGIKTAEEWSSVLKLSSLWNFEEIEKLAIRSLTMSPKTYDFTPAQMVKLGFEHNIRFWVVRGGAELVKRSERLSIEEGEEMGIMATVVIGGVREFDRQDRLCPSCGVVKIVGSEEEWEAIKKLENHRFGNLVADAFGWKYEEIVKEEETYKAD
ncbi:hypothetical protein JAAARDRAFT_706786 [Jaapia argillacea MUCL 33604]|uniref:BTB domain-containing protein n=1 Tax=Jaapia argillacea MUCL 33604 TaxID=933084 RepID=A0A067PL30_9AGAM|nr:hypothetical protein JAAARDRAFT_706786 [Jaapia argillacea MUCL 33604]